VHTTNCLAAVFKLKQLDGKVGNAIGGNWHWIDFWADELTISVKIPFHVTSSETQYYKVTLCERILKEFGCYLNSHIVYRFNADLTKQFKFLFAQGRNLTSALTALLWNGTANNGLS
jgi:hypothetical protein